MNKEKKEMKVQDGFYVTVAGKKKRFEVVKRKMKGEEVNKGLLYITVDFKNGKQPHLFRFDVWDVDMIEKLSNIDDGCLIRVTSKPHNYDYEHDGKKIYSFDLTLERFAPYSGKEYTEFALAGRLVKDITLVTGIGKPCMGLRVACNNGSKPTYCNIQHYGYSLNLAEFGKKGEPISLEGYVHRSNNDGTLTFFATKVWSNNPNAPFVKELEEETRETK